MRTSEDEEGKECGGGDGSSGHVFWFVSTAQGRNGGEVKVDLVVESERTEWTFTLLKCG